ncbi:hypothetical protein B296_00051631, partial [Ensete ventricosum]
MTLSLLPPYRERRANVRGAWLGNTGRPRCTAWGPPSSANIIVKNLCACPVGAVCASVSAEWARLVLARAFIMGATGHSYLRSLLPLWLTMPSYFSTPSMVLAVRCALYTLQLWHVGLTHVRSVVQSLTPPCLCQVGFAVAGRPCWRSNRPRESFYNRCYRSFILEILIASMAYHAVVLLHTVRGPYSEVCALPAAAMACRPYSRWLLHAYVRSASLWRVDHIGDLVVQGSGDVVA